ncbi:MAG: DUF2027 domain-containing protein [Bacteroidota bacterium]|nr:DUF2027 domain-containing protein [Bacteroidota bacterium]
MIFKVGDKVKFLNDVGGGVVAKVKQQIAYVETNDGFEIPVLFSELVKVEEVGFGGMKPEPVIPQKQQKTVAPVSVFQEDTEDFDEVLTEEPTDDEIITTENSTLNILLGLVPVKLKGRMEPDFHVHLISDCAYRMLYTFSIVKDNFVYGKKAGMVEEDTKVQVLSFSMSELKQIQSFKINCIFYKKGIYLPHESLIYEYRIDPLAMADPSNWEENDYFDEKAIVVNVTEMSLLYEIERIVTESEDKFVIQKKRKDFKPKKQAQNSTSEKEEIDLHIEQLVEDFSGMSAGEILDIQMGRFTIALEGAIRNHVHKIVFIHGVGNGKLKYEIRKTLDSKYSKLRYQDASFKEYGYGATLVMIK